MSDTKKLNEGVVKALAGNDLVLAADANGKLQPISLANLLAAVRGSIKVGGRNLVKGTATPLTSIATKGYELTADLSKEPAGSEITLSFRYEFSGITLGNNPRFGILTAVKDMGAWEEYAACYFYPTSASGEGRAVAVKTLPAGMDISTSKITAFIQRVSGGTVKLYDIKVERGNVATDWTPAPEDVLANGGVKRNQSIICVIVRKGGARHERSEDFEGSTDSGIFDESSAQHLTQANPHRHRDTEGRRGRPRPENGRRCVLRAFGMPERTGGGVAPRRIARGASLQRNRNTDIFRFVRVAQRRHPLYAHPMERKMGAVVHDEHDKSGISRIARKEVAYV